ncbi:hypothetical protein D9M72_320290 [compost metagenome]
MLDRVDRRIRHVEGVVAQAHQAVPAGLVVAGEELETTQAPVVQVIAFHVGDEVRIGHHAGAEHRHPPGHGQHALGQRHGAHVEVALGETQLVPLAHDVAAAHLAELVGGQAADIREELEPGHGLSHHAFGQHGVAVDHRHHRIRVRQLAGDGAEAVGQAIALAGAGNAHEVQLDPRRRRQLGPEVLHQQLVGQLDDGADHGGRVAAVDGFLDHRAVDHGGGQCLDAEAGHHQEHVGRGRRVAEFGQAPLVPGVDEVEEQRAACEVQGAHGVAPDAHGPDQQQEMLGIGIEDGLGQCQCQQHQRDEVEQPARGFEQATFEFFHWDDRPVLVVSGVPPPARGGGRALTSRYPRHCLGCPGA